ncbi:MAG: hypothetical protein WCW35_09910 [Bacteroidota bacterium]
MKFTTFFFFSAVCSSLLFSQSILDTHDPNQPLTAEQCFDVIKTVWDGLKKNSEDYMTISSEKSEFESTAEFNDRIRKAKDEYINKIRKFYSDNKLNSRTYSVWLKAELAKYDADNQTYGIKSPTQILVQPKKKDISVTVQSNKYVTITEKNSAGYRRAYIHLNTNPEFTWFVNKQTAQDAKGKEQNIFFKLSFTFDISFDETANQVVLQVVPTKLSLMNQAENFTYWSEEIR